MQTHDNRFYVEVTCISIETAESYRNVRTRLSESDPFGLIEAVFRECQGKARQCSNLDGPALVAIGTWNGFAARTGFDKRILASVLAGKLHMTFDVSFSGEIGEHRLATNLESAAFLKRDKSETVGFARNSISGLLLCDCGSSSAIGVLHPNPVRPFSHELLPKVEFGFVNIDRTENRLMVGWQGGSK